MPIVDVSILKKLCLLFFFYIGGSPAEDKIKGIW